MLTLDANPFTAAIHRQRLAQLESAISSQPAEPYGLSFGDHIANVCPSFPFTRHTTRLVGIGQQIADGELPRVMVELPPRHYKSTVFSRFLPSYFLRRFPDRTVGQGANTQTLAEEFSEAARDYYLASGGTLHYSAKSKDRWKTGGGMGGEWAAGVGKGTGLPADFLNVDDPIKGREEAESPAYRRRLKNWYSTVLNTREEPGGFKLITHTRWHVDDLIGWLLATVEELEREGNGDAAERWHVISLPLIAEPILKPLPALVSRAVDDREPGEALDPTRYDAEWARRKQLNTPRRDWLALYQQGPEVTSGSVFFRQWFRYWAPKGQGQEGDTDEPKAFIRTILSVDAAFKDTTNSDYVALLLWGQTDAGMFLLNIVNQRLSFTATVAMITTLHEQRAFSELLVEDKANGSAVIDTLKQQAKGYSIREVNPMGGKIPRANASTLQWEQGRVFLPRLHPMLKPYEDQHLAFPSTDQDDMVDATSQVLNFIAGTGPMRVTTVAYGYSAGSYAVDGDDDEDDI